MIVNNRTWGSAPVCSSVKPILINTRAKIISMAAVLLMGLFWGTGLMAAPITFWSPESGCVELSGIWVADIGPDGESGTEDDNDTCTMTQNFADKVTVPLGNPKFTLDGAGYTTQGVTLAQGEDFTLKNMTIDAQGSGVGLFIYKANQVTVSNVTILNAYAGVLLRGSGSNLITNSSISVMGSQNGYGVWFDLTTVGVYPNDVPLGSNNNVLENNTITAIGIGDAVGVYLGPYSEGNDITENTISDFNWGLEVGHSSDQHDIHLNNFVDNPLAVYASSSSGNFNGNYYTNYDEAIEGCFDTDSNGVCDSGYSHIGGAFDNSPWTTLDGGLNAPDATGTVTVADGGTVATSDQSVMIDVASNSVEGDTTIEIYLEQITNPDITVGNSGNFDTALAIYQFGPDGTNFDPEAFLTLTIDVTALTELQRSLISVYRHEDTDADGDIDADDGFRMIAGTVCGIEEDPVDTFTAICVAPIDHFSRYAIILLSDSDEDGVPDSDDLCPDTSSGGFDADADGCMDTFAGLSELIIDLTDGGEVSPKMANSLLSKINNAEKSAGKNEVCESVDKLERFTQQVSSQNGKKVSSDAAIMLLDYASSLIAYLQALLEPSGSCDI